MFVLMMVRPLIPQFLAEVYGLGDFEIGLLGSISFFGSVVLGILLGRMGDLFGKPYSLAASMAVYGLSLSLFVVSNNFSVLLIAAFLAGVSYINWSLMSAIIGPMAPENAKARWISVPQTISMMFSFMSPYVGGVFYDFSPQYPFILAIAACLGTAAASCKMSKVF